MAGADDPSRGELEWVDAGEEVLPGPPHQRRRRRLWWVALAAALIALIVVLATRSGGRNAAGPTGRESSAASSARPSTAPSSARPTTSPTSAGITSTAAPAVSVTEVGHALLGITTDWDLFARGTGMLVRIEFARGRITRTVLPGLASSGPVSFLAAPHAAIIRPLDVVPGYLVPDGQRPHALTRALASGGVLLPGPSSGQFWAQSDQGGGTHMTLVGPAGQRLESPHAVRVSIPPTMDSFPGPDGAGYVLLSGIGGVYDLRPAGIRRITTGAVIAVGPTRWLAAECNEQARCSLVAIDQASGVRHTVRSFADNSANVSGAISPDGHNVALLQLTNTAGGGRPVLHLIDLDSGAERRIALALNPSATESPSGALVWSPDSRWLFATDVRGQLHAVDANTGRVHSLDVPLPPLGQLAIR